MKNLKLKYAVLLLITVLGFTACSSDDEGIKEPQTGQTDDTGGNNTGGDNNGGDNINQTTVTKTEFSLMKDVDRETVFNNTSNLFEKYIYDFSGNDYSIAITGAKDANTYEIKLTGRLLKKEFTKELVLNTGVTNPARRIYVLKTSDFEIDPDTYDVVIVEKETNKEFDLESLKLNSNPNDVPYDIISKNNTYNLGAIEFSNITQLTPISVIQYSDARNINLYDSNIFLRAKNVVSTKAQANLEIYTTTGTLVKTIVLSSIVGAPQGGALHYIIASNKFNGIALGTYLFRLVENVTQFPVTNRKSELATYEIINAE